VTKHARANVAMNRDLISRSDLSHTESRGRSAPLGDPGLAPGRLGDFKSPGSAVPAEASRREIGGHEGTCTPKAARF
jgi:hypothetical protein